MLKPQADWNQDDLARELRSAVLGNDHHRAAAIAERYAAALNRQWALLSEAERASSSLPKQARELLTWAREMTLVHQALLSEQLSIVEKAGRRLAARALYLQTAAPDPQS